MTQLEVTSPYDGHHVGSVEMHDEAACEHALAEAHSTFEARDRWLPAHERLRILERCAALIEQRADSLAKQAAAEGGKPLRDSQVEVSRGVEGVRTALAELRTWGGREVPMGLSARTAGRAAFTYREPRGPILALSAFNHPFNLIVHQAIPAIAAGAPVVVKPASATPLSCRSLVSILYEAGLPERFCRMVMCDNTIASKLAADPRVSLLSFIGSAKVGWKLRSALAPGAVCVLEHGGTAPVIVDQSADLDDALPLLVKAGFYHAGQVCVSLQRIYAHRSLCDRLVDALVGRVSALSVGDPSSADTEVGPLIRETEVRRVHEWVEEAVQGGARLLCGGRALSSSCYAPTVLLDPPERSRISRQEVFGPVVAVYPYDELDDAIARANAPSSYFQAAVFTRDLDVALRASRRLHGMAVMINDHTAFRADWMPFGGHRDSGLGMGGIGYSMRDMSLERMVVIRSPAFP